MASYKQPCMNCGSLTDRDARFCPKCGSSAPFGYHCPTCLAPIEKGNRLCSSCGRPLYITCPRCGKQTFVCDNCEQCGVSLMVKCSDPRCGQMQFFENTKCTACGKKLKK